MGVVSASSATVTTTLKAKGSVWGVSVARSTAKVTVVLSPGASRFAARQPLPATPPTDSPAGAVTFSPVVVTAV